MNIYQYQCAQPIQLKKVNFKLMVIILFFNNKDYFDIVLFTDLVLKKGSKFVSELWGGGLLVL